MTNSLKDKGGDILSRVHEMEKHVPVTILGYEEDGKFWAEKISVMKIEKND